MKIIYLLFVSIITCTTIAEAQNIKITIDEIERDNQITGKISGITGSAATYCVVVYVHTDKWYIHPFANGGEGKSWAPIDGSGAWQIATVRREFPADKMAAVLLHKSPDGQCDASPISQDALPTTSRQVSIVIKTLKGTEDYNKL